MGEELARGADRTHTRLTELSLLVCCLMWACFLVLSFHSLPFLPFTLFEPPKDVWSASLLHPVLCSSSGDCGEHIYPHRVFILGGKAVVNQLSHIKVKLQVR